MAKLTSAEDVRCVMGVLGSMGIGCTWSGLCVWVEKGLPKRKAADVAEIGAVWSGKRGQWYFRAVEGLEVTA